HESVAVLVMWSMYLLARHPHWQQRLRSEVVRVVGGGGGREEREAGTVKDMHMVLLETLRLFPPVPVVTRTSKQDVRIGPYVIPKGVDLFLPVGCLHADERYWGADAREFKPERFQDGQQAACSHPQAFIPFSSGPRDCVGAMFGLIEAKIILSHLLLNASWSISPSYQHQPTAALTAQAKHGMPLLFSEI
ncbi:unnamed protein product, partial [Closterium sp. NIES-64]